MIQINKISENYSYILIPKKDFGLELINELQILMDKELLKAVSYRTYSFVPTIFYEEIEEYKFFFNKFPDLIKKEIKEKKKEFNEFGTFLNKMSKLKDQKTSEQKLSYIKQDEELSKEFTIYQNLIEENISKKIFEPENLEITKKQIINSFQQTQFKNTANFSEPGTGKTLMTLYNYIYKTKGEFNDWRIIVVSPISAFMVWKKEITKFIKITFDLKISFISSTMFSFL